jgi:DNA-3-methyladenine glycosylase
MQSEINTVVPSQLEALPRSFYTKDTIEASKALLGHWLLRRIDGVLCGGPIVETEAYLTNDPACHAYLKETPRNRSMWGAPGHAYVYRIYGYHFCFNAVCRPASIAEAVLVRGIEPQFGIETLRQFRTADDKNLTNGPAKFCAAMNIELGLDGSDICSIDAPIFIARNPDVEEFCDNRGPLVETTRIGITKAADWPLRWYLDGSRHVSKRVPKRMKALTQQA